MNLTKLTKPRARWSIFKLKIATAIERLIYDKLTDYDYSVKDFGAIGDGVVDDTDAIQRALDTKRHVFFPVGRYRVTKRLSFYNGQHISGANPTSEKSQWMPSQNSVIVQHTRDIGLFEHMSKGTALGCSFSNLMLEALEQATAGCGSTGIEIGRWGAKSGDSDWWKCQSIRNKYTNVFIKGFDIGMSVAGWSWESTYERCYFFRCSQIGARIGSGGTGITQFEHCSFVHINSSNGSIGRPVSGIGLLIESAKINLNDTRFEATDGTGLELRAGECDAFTPYFESNLAHHISLTDGQGDKDKDSISRFRSWGGVWAHGITHYSLLRVGGDNAHVARFEGLKSYSFGASQQSKYGMFHLPNKNASVTVTDLETNEDVLFNNWNGCPAYLTLKDYPNVVFTRTKAGTLKDSLRVDVKGAPPDYVVPHKNIWSKDGETYSAQDLLSFAKGNADNQDALANESYKISGNTLRRYHENPKSLWVCTKGQKIFGHTSTGNLNGKTIDLTGLMGVQAPNYSSVNPTFTVSLSKEDTYVGRKLVFRDSTAGTGSTWNVTLPVLGSEKPVVVKVPPFGIVIVEVVKNSAGGDRYWMVTSQTELTKLYSELPESFKEVNQDTIDNS